ncbi:MAG: COX15/CtaA family protein [Chloroflexi bacterium]|nr:COX15/CtaA family protein [Chloroflexota bacterium]
MIQNTTPGKRSRIVFKVLALLSLIMAFGQVTLGGVVRVTGSGLGCGDDWPLCNGHIIPPFNFETIIEYSHRLSATTVGVFVLATLVVAWWAYRTRPWVYVPSIASLVLVIVAGAFGAVTVWTDLSWGGRLVHLVIAESLITALVVANVAAWRHIRPEGEPAAEGTVEAPRLSRLPVAMMVGMLVIILSGSFMVGQGFGSSCATWPLCRGEFFPEGEAFATHMGHRYMAAIVGVVVLWTGVWAWRGRTRWQGVEVASVSLVVTFIAQVLFGAAVVWSGFDREFKGLHLSLATLTWMAGSYLIAAMRVPTRFQPRVSEFRKPHLSEAREPAA